MVVSKGKTILAQSVVFNSDIREWLIQPADLKTWAEFNVFFYKRWDKRRNLKTAVKGGHTAAVQNTGRVPLTAPTEEKKIHLFPECNCARHVGKVPGYGQN